MKIEVNHVFRGTVLPVERRSLRAEARRQFTTEWTAPVLATPELYGSKVVAALDRQHPRDLFDLLGLFESGSLSQEVVECFVCYLAGHNRPVHEVLFSRDHDLSAAFENEFIGLTRQPITLDRLVAVRRELRSQLPSALTDNHRRFRNCSGGTARQTRQKREIAARTGWMKRRQVRVFRVFRGPILAT